MTTFAFASVTYPDLSEFLRTVEAIWTERFSGVAQIHKDVELVDLSDSLRTLNLTPIDRADRLFLLCSGNPALAAGLAGLLHHIETLHGSRVNLVLTQMSEDGVERAFKQAVDRPIFGIVKDTQDVRREMVQLVEALVYEYVAVRLEQRRKEEVRDLVLRILGAQRLVVGSRPGIDTALEQLDIPFGVRWMLREFLQLRLRLGQPLEKALEELLPLAYAGDGGAVLARQLGLEVEVLRALRGGQHE
ncbi:MAG: hypothetical protein QJR06_07105 [Alicyclobacillaceae bacterium]|nr:hypothetical protein [Alicyclobacillaceae bacterium]